jgi:hypothetical protein
VPRYAAFGFTLESPVELPELDVASVPGAPDWRIEIDRSAVGQHDVTAISIDAVNDGVAVRAYSSNGSLGLAFDDTGTFEVRPADRVIVWRPGPRAAEPAVRTDLLGRVIALVAHADGHLALHASAVSIGGRSIAFLGAKGAGKSTLALALVRRGARLVADDTLVVRMDAVALPWAAPGVQRVRLWPDSATALHASLPQEPGAKPTIDRLAASALEPAPVPLSACYVIETGRESLADAIRRERLNAVHATLACVRFAKLGALASGVMGEAMLHRAAALASAVPMFVASVPRDLRRLDDAARAFVAWHDADTPSNLAGVG